MCQYIDGLQKGRRVLLGAELECLGFRSEEELSHILFMSADSVVGHDCLTSHLSQPRITPEKSTRRITVEEVVATTGKQCLPDTAEKLHV